MYAHVPCHCCVTNAPTTSGLEAAASLLLTSAVRQSLLGTADPCTSFQPEKQLEGWAKSPDVSFSHLATDAGCQQET